MSLSISSFELEKAVLSLVSMAHNNTMYVHVYMEFRTNNFGFVGGLTKSPTPAPLGTTLSAITLHDPSSSHITK